MRWLIALIIFTISGTLGFFTAFAGVEIFPNDKITKPRPENELVGIDESGNVNFAIRDGETVAPEIYEHISRKYEDNDQKVFLIMGTDVVYSGRKKVSSLKGRTDSIILAKLSGDRLDLLSIPRDSRVEIPGHGFDKINHANVYGGPELVVQTIEKWLNIDIDDYVMINTFGIVKLVDLFGGIDYNVPKRMYYVDRSGGLYINIKAGPQHMDGLTVHNYLRFRHDALGDLNRVKRQQEVIKVLMDKILQPQNIIKVPSAISLLNNNVQTSLATTEILYLANKAFKMQSIKENITMNTIPGEGKMTGGAWYWFTDEAATRQIISSLALKPLNH